MSRLQFDTRELPPLAALLRAAGEAALAGGEKVVAKGAVQIKADARRLAPSGGHAKFYPQSINYDLNHGDGWVEAEIGPVEGRRQRGLGNLLEYGGPYNRPHPHLEPALDTEEPKFYAAAEALAADLIERFGR